MNENELFLDYKYSTKDFEDKGINRKNVYAISKQLNIYNNKKYMIKKQMENGFEANLYTKEAFDLICNYTINPPDNNNKIEEQQEEKESLFGKIKRYFRERKARRNSITYIIRVGYNEYFLSTIEEALSLIEILVKNGKDRQYISITKTTKKMEDL